MAIKEFITSFEHLHAVAFGMLDVLNTATGTGRSDVALRSQLR